MDRQMAMSFRARAIEMRDSLRENRDARGDDRCWIDDYSIWRFLMKVPRLIKPTRKEGMRRCTLFYGFRRADTLDPMPADAILDPTSWNADLYIDEDGHRLMNKVDELLDGFQIHYNVIHVQKRPITIDDDRRIYQLLPEKIPGDFRLTRIEEFLGRTKPGAGCPNFWDSHAACGQKCNLHQWGPCKVA